MKSNKKIIFISVIILAIITVIVLPSVFNFNTPNISNGNSNNLAITTVNNTSPNNTTQIIRIKHNVEGTPEYVDLYPSKYLFNTNYTADQYGNVESVGISLKPELMSYYNQIGFFDRPSNTVVIYPIFTQAAYDPNGFYDYYSHNCDSSCLTLKIPDHIDRKFEASGRTTAILQLLHYDFVTDLQLDSNPEILKKYDRVIVLHNEYVTQNEFDAITNHPNVTYLFPNALYAKVSVNYNNGTFTLVRGHGYPTSNIGNGFDWNLDNSKYEYDIKCDNWQFYNITNGEMLNCYPAYRLMFDKELLQELIQ